MTFAPMSPAPRLAGEFSPGVTRLFASGLPAYSAHERAYGPLPAVPNPSDLVREIEASGLTGRGGAGFPTARKIALLRSRTGPGGGRPVVIANGAEGEPLSIKDATLLRHAPHLVIDGLLIAASVAGAADAFLYAGRDELADVRRALGERQDASIVRVHEAGDAFIAGEASAVVNAIAGRPAVPADHIVRLSESGLGGRPTLVQNVETLAQVALVARYGAAWFRTAGTAADPGTRLISVCRDGGATHVAEVPGGIAIGDALRAGNLNPRAASAVLVGGFHGSWVPAHAFDTSLSREGLAPFGGTPGAGILMALGVGVCPLVVSSGIADYLALESARQCGPCVNGLPAMAAILRRLAARERHSGLPAEAERLAALVTGRGSCHHPDGTARFVLSTLTVFAAEVAAHLAGHCMEVHS
jgi:NADH:ubiquinone oxidoreductase subunit F (NADH-binding)